MADSFHHIINLPDRSYQAIARAELKALATRAGFTPYRLAQVDIIIAEITSNLVKHATNGGQVLCRILDEPEAEGLELISIDHGPGISATASAMQDGISSKNTLGQGLGAIQRASDVFDIYSLRGWGTLLLSRVFRKARKSVPPPERVMMHVIRVAKPGEEKCGDNWSILGTEKNVRVLMADGLGHGEGADEAARQAVEAFRTLTGSQANDHLKEIHASIRKTRGAVMSILYLDTVNKQLTYCGVGNILTKLINQPLSMVTRTFSSYNGIVGHTVPNTLNNTVIPWDKKIDVLVMHSDGLSGRWDLAKYPKILSHHPILLCAALYKDHFRSTDDATVAVVRHLKNKS